MISTTILFFALMFPHHNTNTYSTQILDRYIIANNDGSDDAIELFIRENYNPDLANRIKIEDHIKFYRQISGEFGPLNKTVYKTVQSTSDKLIVHLIKESDSPINMDIDPIDILVVEIDLDPENPKYLARGLGLGALVCEIRK